MKKAYIQVAIIVMLIISAATLFYIYINKKTQKISKNIKEVKTFEPGVGGGASSVFGVNLFGGDTNELGGGVSENIDYTTKEDRGFNKLTEVYNLPAAALSFLKDGEIIFTDRANGYSFIKENPDSKNIRLNQNALSQVYDVSYGNSYIIRKILDENFVLRFNLEKINDTNNSVILDPEMKNCKLFEDDLICLKENGESYSFIKINLKDKGLKEDTLYNTIFRYWNIDYKNGSLYLLQSPSAGVENGFLKVKDKKVSVLLRKVGLMAKISDDEQYLLYSFFKNGELKLKLKNIKNNEELELPFVSLADKCAFLENDIICAVPKDLPYKYNPLDGWIKGKFNFDDEFYLYNIESGLKHKIKFQSEKLPERFDAYRFSVSPDKSRVAFINKFNSKAWIISLAQKKDSKGEEKNNDKDSKTEELDIKLKRDEI